MSDHKIATFLLDIELPKRSSGYWKINNSILNGIDYTKMIKRVINDFLITTTREYTLPHILWGTLKFVIRGETIKFCTLQKKNQNRQLLLESKLNTMETSIKKCPTKKKIIYYHGLITREMNLINLSKTTQKGLQL